MAAKHKKLPISLSKPHFAGCFAAAKRLRSITTLNFTTKAPFRRVFRDCETTFWHMSAIWKPCTIILQLRNLHTLKSFSAHTRNRHVTAAPPFRQLLDTSRSLYEVQIMHAISRFKSWEVKSSELQTVHNLKLKRRSYGRLKTSAKSWARISQPRHHLEGCFVAAKPLFGTRVPFAAQFPSFRSCDTAAKSSLSCETSFWHMRTILQPRTLILELGNHFWASKWLRNDLQALKGLWNHLQASKCPSNWKIDLQNGGKFAKTLCKAKRSC